MVHNFPFSERRYPSWLKPTFISLLVAGGYVGIPILLLTFIYARKLQSASQLKSPPTLINVLVACILYSIIFTLTVFDRNRSRPPSPLCMVQAALMQGATPMCVSACFAFLAQAWTKIYKPELDRFSRPLPLFMIIAFPYSVFAAFSIAAYTFGIKKPGSTDTENLLYCTLVRNVLSHSFVAGYCAILIILGVICELAIAVKCYRFRAAVKTLSTESQQTQSSWCLIRTSVLCIFSLLALSACMYILSNSNGAMPVLVRASVPLVTFVFCLKKEVLTTWGIIRPTPCKEEIVSRQPPTSPVDVENEFTRITSSDGCSIASDTLNYESDTIGGPMSTAFRSNRTEGL